jgi:leucine dehydrogenase
MFETLIRAWDGEELVCRFDRPTGTWMFVGVHSTVLGPGMGGTRMKGYRAPEEALRDALRLSGAMTLKQAVADLPFGGGKAVLAVPDVPTGPARRELLLRYAQVVASLGGTYVTAADMNTGQADMDVISERCPYVLGRSPEAGGSGDPGPATARGVFHGIVASCTHAWGGGALAGRSVLVQGVGSVGHLLAQLLREAGASVLVADANATRARDVGEDVGGTVIPPADVIGTACDVYAPCAIGGVLSAETIPRLRCRIVAGAANNQLKESDDASRLRDAGILYAPDYVINAGGVMHLAGSETLRWPEQELARRLRGIGDTLAAVYRSADEEDITTDAAAERLAQARIDAARARSRS